MLKRIVAFIAFSFSIIFFSCSSREARLLGKWQTAPTGDRHQLYAQMQFEFLQGGTVVESGKMRATRERKEKWDQLATGKFRFIDSGNLEVNLGLLYGTTVYEIDWSNADHIRLRAGDDVTDLTRIQ